MEVYISINGVLRNFIQKFEYHYNDHFLETEPDPNAPVEENPFEYRINYPIRNGKLLESFTFQSQDELDVFLYVEYALEIFGYAGVSYATAVTDLNKLIHKNENINFTVIGLDEFGKSRPATLFFLSKNAFTGNNIRFISSKDIKDEWKKCDIWITDDEEILNKCPRNKKVIKFNTDYNKHFNSNIEINNLTKIDELCLMSLEKTTTLMLMKSLGNAVLNIFQVTLKKMRISQLKMKTEKQY